jgi:hypothetical protein
LRLVSLLKDRSDQAAAALMAVNAASSQRPFILSDIAPAR